MKIQRKEENRDMLKRVRSLMIPTVTHGKKALWEELTLMEKMRVDARCKKHATLLHLH